jgi:hypothetical protein
MVDAVNNIAPAQNALLRSGSSSQNSLSSVIPTSISEMDFVSSGIHMDNLQNVAILQYRSSETGEVLRQYPNQSQIEAFKAAQRIADHAAPAPAAPAQQQTVAAPAPAAQGASSAGAPSSPSSSGSGGAGPTTSIIA